MSRRSPALAADEARASWAGHVVSLALIALVALVGFGATHGLTGPMSHCPDEVVLSQAGVV